LREPLPRPRGGIDAMRRRRVLRHTEDASLGQVGRATWSPDLIDPSRVDVVVHLPPRSLDQHQMSSGASPIVPLDHAPRGPRFGRSTTRSGRVGGCSPRRRTSWPPRAPWSRGGQVAVADRETGSPSAALRGGGNVGETTVGGEYDRRPLWAHTFGLPCIYRKIACPPPRPSRATRSRPRPVLVHDLLCWRT